MFVIVYYVGVVIKFVIVVRYCKIVFIGIWKLVKFIIWEKKWSFCLNENLDGLMDIEDNGGILNNRN